MLQRHLYLFPPLSEKIKQTFVFILGDQEEAGYFYHDLTQVNGEENILFFPSSYRRAIKYGQRMRQMRFFARKY